MKTKQISIDMQLNTADALNIERNKQKLASIIKTLLFCGHQDIALKGHRESADSQNPGNFRALITSFS